MFNAPKAISGGKNPRSSAANTNKTSPAIFNSGSPCLFHNSQALLLDWLVPSFHTSRRYATAFERLIIPIPFMVIAPNPAPSRLTTSPPNQRRYHTQKIDLISTEVFNDLSSINGLQFVLLPTL